MTVLRTRLFYLPLFWVFFLPLASWGAEPKVEIRFPKDGSRIAQEQDTVLVSGNVSTQDARTPNVDIFFVVDISGSTALYAGVGFGDSNLPAPSQSGSGPQIGIFGGGFGIMGPPIRDLRNSVLAAEVAATRRLLSQLDAKTTRVGLITFGEDANLLVPITHDFDRLKQALDAVLMRGPHGGTNMVAGIRLAIRELAGLGQSERRNDAIKVQFLLTDGFPTLPIGGGERSLWKTPTLQLMLPASQGRRQLRYMFLPWERKPYRTPELLWELPRPVVGSSRLWSERQISWRFWRISPW